VKTQHEQLELQNLNFYGLHLCYSKDQI